MAEFHLLHEGYLSGTDDDFVGWTVSVVRDGDASIVIDPGPVPWRSAILGPLAGPGAEPDQADALHANRERLLSLPGLARIVPGHRPAFPPDDGTPR